MAERAQVDLYRVAIVEIVYMIQAQRIPRVEIQVNHITPAGPAVVLFHSVGVIVARVQAVVLLSHVH
jgi:hypothetical protein